MKKGERAVPRHQISTRPVCGWHHCGREVMRALVTGETTVLDPVHINCRAEALALVMGARTFELCVLGRGWPVWRNRGLVSEGLPRYGHIHPSHQCGMCWDYPLYADTRQIFEMNYTGMAPPF